MVSATYNQLTCFHPIFGLRSELYLLLKSSPYGLNIEKTEIFLLKKWSNIIGMLLVTCRGKFTKQTKFGESFSSFDKIGMRIRAYKLVGKKKVYGPFSKWSFSKVY